MAKVRIPLALWDVAKERPIGRTDALTLTIRLFASSQQGAAWKTRKQPTTADRFVSRCIPLRRHANAFLFDRGGLTHAKHDYFAIHREQARSKWLHHCLKGTHKVRRAACKSGGGVKNRARA
jgi:hypothetical protein